MPNAEHLTTFYRKSRAAKSPGDLYATLQDARERCCVERLFYFYIPPFRSELGLDPFTVWGFGFEPGQLEAYVEAAPFRHSDFMRRRLQTTRPEPSSQSDVEQWGLADVPALRPLHKELCRIARAGRAHTLVAFGPAGRYGASLTIWAEDRQPTTIEGCLYWTEILRLAHLRYCELRNEERRIDRPFELGPLERRVLTERALGRQEDGIKATTGIKPAQQQYLLGTAAKRMLLATGKAIAIVAKAVAHHEVTSIDQSPDNAWLRTGPTAHGLKKVKVRRDG